MIPEAAVEAAVAAVEQETYGAEWARRIAIIAVQAAAPHLLAPLLALADERDKTRGTIRGHITTHELRHALDTHDDTQGET